MLQKGWLLICLLALAQPAWPDSLQGLGLARVLEVNGEATYEREGLGVLPIQACYALNPGTVVRTKKGTLTLGLDSGAKVYVQNNTRLLIAPVEKKENTTMKLLSGLLRLAVAKLEGREILVETDNAVAAVKGTDFETSLDDGVAKVLVFSSHNGKGVAMTDRASGKTMAVGPGQAGVVDQTGLTVRDMSLEEQGRAAAWGTVVETVKPKERRLRRAPRYSKGERP